MIHTSTGLTNEVKCFQGKHVNHKGRNRRFTNPEELEEERRKQEQQKKWRQQQGISSSEDEEDEGAGEKAISEESSSEEESDSDDVIANLYPILVSCFTRKFVGSA